MADVILVHGAGTGGWLWDDVAVLLRAEGHRVLAPTLRGVGGPATAADRDGDLSTHIDAVTELAEVEQPDRLTLVGFSYGGFVVTGAAARLGDRVTEVIYLDASVPQPGRSFIDLLPEPARSTMQASATALGDGWRIPPAPLEMRRRSRCARTRRRPRPRSCRPRAPRLPSHGHLRGTVPA